MELTLSELRTLNELKAIYESHLREIGALETHKIKLLQATLDTESQMQRVMSSIGERLAIPQGKKWGITPDGKVQLDKG